MLSFYVRRFQIVLLSLSVSLLVACGGGGGGKDPVQVGVSSSSSSSSSSSIESSSSFSSSSSETSSSSSSSSSSAAANVCLTTASEGNAGSANVPGFSVVDGKLVDGKGNAFVMRGVNYPHAWYHSQHSTAEKLADIASTCSNTVRIVLANGEQWSRTSGTDVAAIISAAKANNLITMLEVHDVTGYPENASAADPQTAVDYWLSQDIRTAIEGEEGFVLINIANEPFGNAADANADRTQWLDFHTAAVQQLRAAGLKHTLVVDAPNWGQDWRNTMRDGATAQTLFDSDVEKNIVFSVHMYQVYNTAQKVQDYLQAFESKNLPLIVGEFAADHGTGVANDVAEAAILEYAQELGVGYLGWSWSGNSGGLDSLDIVINFNVDNLSSWGESLINGNHGIRATARMCSCFLND